MANAAVIADVERVAGSFAEAAPGHRFNLYFPIWREDWDLEKTGKTDALRKSGIIPSEVAKLLDAIRARQGAVFAGHPDGLCVQAVSNAPFATGLGNEHPVENGFAFLTPYGLPYLAGSGVKGVLRRAAEELALLPEEYPSSAEGARLTMLDVWWLFGFEGAAGAWWELTKKEDRDLPEEDKQVRTGWREIFTRHVADLADRSDLPDFLGRAFAEDRVRARYLDDPSLFVRNLDALRQTVHTRGALDFWDVFPQPPRKGPGKDRLAVEIMTPHYREYYQGKPSALYPAGPTPHDAGQPNPIPFLAVPAGSAFDFRVICHVDRLPAGLRGRWKVFMNDIFDHAFLWLGFGAKTSVGYGAMELDPAVILRAEEERRQAELERQQREAAEAERAKRAAEAAEAAARQAAFDALPEIRKRMHEVEEAVGRYAAAGALDQKRSRDEVKAAANKLIDTGANCEEVVARVEAATLLADTYDKIGWHDPGAKADKRKKQRAKLLRAIERVRGS